MTPDHPATRTGAAGGRSRRERSWLVWTARELDEETPRRDEPAVIDSWLVDDGRARALALHDERFRRACGEHVPALAADEIARFLAAVRADVPPQGRWFPRVEAHRGAIPRLAVWMRPAPELRAEARIWAPSAPDPRRYPRTKGADLAALAALRAQARAEGADDALLRGRDGVVLEAAHAALVWWRGDALALPDPALPVLPSVTAALLRELARTRGVPIREERCRLQDLDGCEVWAVNALHGIRPVVSWVGAAVRPASPRRERLAEWRDDLRRLAEPIGAPVSARR